jgi:hypothetical protein
MMNPPAPIPPTPEQLVRRARFRAWVERNWHLLGKPWPGTETMPETPTQAK